MSSSAATSEHGPTNPVLAIVVAVVGSLVVLGIASGIAAFLMLVDAPLPVKVDPAVCPVTGQHM